MSELFPGYDTGVHDCPVCGANICGHTQPPAPEDAEICLTICFACSALLVLGEGSLLRAPTKDEQEKLARLDQWPQLELLQATIRKMRAVEKQCDALKKQCDAIDKEMREEERKAGPQ